MQAMVLDVKAFTLTTAPLAPIIVSSQVPGSGEQSDWGSDSEGDHEADIFKEPKSAKRRHHKLNLMAWTITNEWQ